MNIHPLQAPDIAFRATILHAIHVLALVTRAVVQSSYSTVVCGEIPDFVIKTNIFQHKLEPGNECSTRYIKVDSKNNTKDKVNSTLR